MNILCIKHRIFLKSLIQKISNYFINPKCVLCIALHILTYLFFPSKHFTKFNSYKISVQKRMPTSNSASFYTYSILTILLQPQPGLSILDY